MTKGRVKLSLEEPTSIDVSNFKPRASRHVGTASADEGDAVAAGHGFTPREQSSTGRRKRNRPPPYDAHMSIRAYQADVDAFHALANEMGWKSGRLLSELIKVYNIQNSHVR